MLAEGLVPGSQSSRIAFRFSGFEQGDAGAGRILAAGIRSSPPLFATFCRDPCTGTGDTQFMSLTRCDGLIGAGSQFSGFAGFSGHVVSGTIITSAFARARKKSKTDAGRFTKTLHNDAEQEEYEYGSEGEGRNRNRVGRHCRNCEKTGTEAHHQNKQGCQQTSGIISIAVKSPAHQITFWNDCCSHRSLLKITLQPRDRGSPVIVAGIAKRRISTD